MKRPLKLFAPETGAGEGAPKPIDEPKAPDVDIEALKKELRAEIEKEIKEKNQIEIDKQKELAKLEEVEKLRQKNIEFEKKLADFEKKTKDKEFELAFKEFAIKEGASKTDQLLRLADKEKTPEEAVKNLKKDLPELFLKKSTINDIGGGIKGEIAGKYSVEDISKMSIDEYKAFREEHKL